MTEDAYKAHSYPVPSEGGELDRVKLIKWPPPGAKRLCLSSSSIPTLFKHSKYQTTPSLPSIYKAPQSSLFSLSSSIMKAFTLPIILGLLATVCHAAPSTAQPQARQVTTLIIDFFGAGANPPSYEIDVPLASSENFQSFNISESLSFFLPSPTHAERAAKPSSFRVLSIPCHLA